MKKFFVGAVILALSVGTLGAEQKFSSLPIGSNLDDYIISIQIWYGPLGSTINGTFPYNRRQDGTLETFAVSKLQEMASQFVPKAGQETTLYGYGISAITEGIGGLLPTYNGESKPATIAVAPPAGEYNGFYPVLRNGKWEVPEEVFGKVRFQFGWGVGYYIPGVTDLEVNLYEGSRISRFSTRERISDSDNPCELPAILLAFPDAVIPNEIALARHSWWKYAEITLHTPDRFVTFVVNRTAEDGKAIRWSSPPPSFFVPPMPNIARIARTGNTTEIVVENADTPVFEFSTDLVLWRQVSGSEIVLQSTNPSVFRHRTDDASGFYRLRILDGAQ